jgi:hypothetical protein
MPFTKFVYLMYPRIYKVTDVHQVLGFQRSYGGDPGCTINWGFFTDESEQLIVKPKVIPALLEKITTQDVYIMDNGEYINVFVASDVNPRYVQDVFGYDNFAEYAMSIDSGATPFQQVEGSEPSQIIHTLLEQLRYEKGGTAGSYAPVRVFVDGATSASKT